MLLLLSDELGVDLGEELDIDEGAMDLSSAGIDIIEFAQGVETMFLSRKFSLSGDEGIDAIVLDWFEVYTREFRIDHANIEIGVMDDEGI